MLKQVQHDEREVTSFDDFFGWTNFGVEGSSLSPRHPELVSACYFAETNIKMLKQVQHDGIGLNFMPLFLRANQKA